MSNRYAISSQTTHTGAIGVTAAIDGLLLGLLLLLDSPGDRGRNC